MKWVSFFGIGLNPQLFPIEETTGIISKNEIEYEIITTNCMKKKKKK